MTVRLDIRDDLAIVAIDHPPVNSLNHAVRLGLFDSFRTIRANPAIRAAILTGDGKGFCAGGDIRELGTSAAGQPPGLSSDVHPAIENAGKPVIAALHGFALGGGLETALVCHARIATGSTILGLPECRLGIIPLSGTQRLPRLTSLAATIDVIVFDKRLKAAEARALGIVDRLVDDVDQLLPAAIRLAHEFLGRAAPPPPSRRPICTPASPAVLDAARRLLAAQGTPAQFGALEAIDAALGAQDFEAGLTSARRIYRRLLDSDASRRARDLFLKE